jgi:hypothetical protein
MSSQYLRANHLLNYDALYPEEKFELAPPAAECGELASPSVNG